MAYSRRLIDEELDALGSELPAIALDGPKGVGKTATASRRVRTVLAFDSPEILQVTEAEPERVLAAPRPVLLDEWQHLPASWDLVRRAVDDGAPAGSFLLTGSATPTSRTPVHSGAGRIVSLRMRPMALCERGVAEPTVSLAALLTAPGTEIAGTCALRLADYVHEIEASGLPGIRTLPDRARRAQLDGYLTRSLSKDLTDEQNVTVRRPHSLRGWITAYAAASSSTATWEAIRSSASPGEADPPSKVTSIRYRDWLTALWLLDPLPAWTASGITLKGLTSAPKHHLADPALAARLLKATEASLLDGTGDAVKAHSGTRLGSLFESLATLTVRTCAQTAEATTGHLRIQRGEREVDLIVEGPDGRVVGLEVKLSRTVTDRDVRHLLWLRDTLGDTVTDLVVLTTGTEAFRRRDGVAVVPLGLLGL